MPNRAEILKQVVLWAWISQVVNPDRSLSHAVKRITTWLATSGEPIPSSDTGMFRKHHARHCGFCRGKTLGIGDHRVVWQRPTQCPQSMSQEAFEAADDQRSCPLSPPRIGRTKGVNAAFRTSIRDVGTQQARHAMGLAACR
ncbi:MAG: hypothetical protein AAFR24_13220 [Cyanobacteria bacterium J06627_3]